jgi:hypothetical protein
MISDPRLNIYFGKPPTSLHLKSRDLLAPRQPVEGSLGDLEVVGDFADVHGGVVSWAGWHGLGQINVRKRQHSAKFSNSGGMMEKIVLESRLTG